MGLGEERPQRLVFRKKYVELLLSGRKRTTIRLGKVRIRSRVVVIAQGQTPVALARVEEVRYKKVRDLTEEDAREDGFKNLIELFRELRSIYGDFSLDDDITIVRLSIIKRLNGGLTPGAP